MTAKPSGRPWAKVVNPANTAKIATASAIDVSFLRVEIETRLNANAIVKSQRTVQAVQMATPPPSATRGSSGPSELVRNQVNLRNRSPQAKAPPPAGGEGRVRPTARRRAPPGMKTALISLVIPGRGLRPRARKP